MNSYRVSTTAQRDLRNIVRHIAIDNAGAAKRVSNAIQRTFEFLASCPEAAPARPEVREGLRVYCAMKPANQYVIIYEAIESGVLIVGVLHGQRDWPSIFRLGLR